MRVELVFVPCVAAALAFTSQRGLDVLRRRPPPSPPTRSDEPQIFEVSDGGDGGLTGGAVRHQSLLGGPTLALTAAPT